MPLKGKIIITTQPSESAERLEKILVANDAVVYKFPMVEIYTSELSNEHFNAFENLKTYNWIVFTSRNGIKSFFELIQKFKPGMTIPDTIKFAVIGKSTAEELIRCSYQPKFVGNGNSSEGFSIELKSVIQKNERVLLPVGNIAGDNIETGLKDVALVDRLNVYLTQKVMPVDNSVLGLIYSNSYDILIFTSPSAFDHFYELIRKDILSLNLKVACIGKTTAKAINSKGINPLIIANDSSIAGLAEAINNYFN